MAAPQARMGDSTSHGGTIVTGAERTLIDGMPAARMGDLHSCPEHGTTEIVQGSEKTLIEGKPAARVGDMTDCGAVIVTGSETALVE
jgi:uncharacterized Zn-binding protein involved in type VI secretion